MLQGWDSLTMAFTGKFVYMAHQFNLATAQSLWP